MLPDNMIIPPSAMFYAWRQIPNSNKDMITIQTIWYEYFSESLPISYRHPSFPIIRSREFEIPQTITHTLPFHAQLDLPIF